MVVLMSFVVAIEEDGGLGGSTMVTLIEYEVERDLKALLSVSVILIVYDFPPKLVLDGTFN